MTIEKDSKEKIAAFLPGALKTVLHSYETFLQNKDADPKPFVDHHNACKAAMAHIELLLKLADRILDMDGVTTDYDALRHMMNKAQEELSAYHAQAENRPVKDG